MKFYETTYIVHSALQEGRLNDITESVNSFVKSAGGEILYFDNWGRKKLSYMIEKQKYGTYIFLQFKISDYAKVRSLNIEFEHNPNILRALVVKIDESNIFEKIDNESDKEKNNAAKVDSEKEENVVDKEKVDNSSLEAKEEEQLDDNKIDDADEKSKDLSDAEDENKEQ